MKILFISMPSIHVIRWLKNLEDTNHELYWFDILGRGRLKTEQPIKQFTGWQKRKVHYLTGEYFLEKNAPKIYNKLERLIKVTVLEALQDVILKIQPDIVHSFEMQSCSYPILKLMKKFTDLKWMYSCWGSDLYYYRAFKYHRKMIRKVLKRVNYLQTDNERDIGLALNLGFTGTHFSPIAGGGGYKTEITFNYAQKYSSRKIILVKGYEHKFGRALVVLKALRKIAYDIRDYEIVVFGAHPQIFKYVQKNNLACKIYSRHQLDNEEVIKLMGKSLIYIGNSVSDGIPNTLLESLMMGAFPIQSNPGFVSEEVIEHGVNGFLIKDPNNITEIASLILMAINDKNMLYDAALNNQTLIRKKVDYRANQKKILKLYEIAIKENA